MTPPLGLMVRLTRSLDLTEPEALIVSPGVEVGPQVVRSGARA